MRNHNCKKSTNKFWFILGGATLAALAVSLLANLPDIKRYIKINTM